MTHIHARFEREVVDWTEFNSVSTDCSAYLHDYLYPSYASSVWFQIFAWLSFIINIGCLAVVLKVPMLRGVTMHVLRTFARNVLALLFRDELPVNVTTLSTDQGPEYQDIEVREVENAIEASIAVSDLHDHQHQPVLLDTSSVVIDMPVLSDDDHFTPSPYDEVEAVMRPALSIEEIHPFPKRSSPTHLDHVVVVSNDSGE